MTGWLQYLHCCGQLTCPAFRVWERRCCMPLYASEAPGHSFAVADIMPVPACPQPARGSCMTDMSQNSHSRLPFILVPITRYQIVKAPSFAHDHVEKNRISGNASVGFTAELCFGPSLASSTCETAKVRGHGNTLNTYTRIVFLRIPYCHSYSQHVRTTPPPC